MIVQHERDAIGAYAFVSTRDDTLSRLPTRNECLYALGRISPNYPVPSTEYVNALAMSPDRVSFYTKLLLLQAGEFTLKHKR